MMLATKLFDEWDPELTVVFKLDQLIRVNYVTYIASDHDLTQVPINTFRRVWETEGDYAYHLLSSLNLSLFQNRLGFDFSK